MLGGDIRKLVLSKLEERSPFASPSTEIHLTGGDLMDEVKPIEEYIGDFLAEAANEVLSVIPWHLAPKKTLLSVPAPDEYDKETGYIALPYDYLRLHTLVMDGWTQPVHHVTLDTDPLYEQQFNRWSRGTRQKPVVVYRRDFADDTVYAAESKIRDADMAKLMVQYYGGGVLQILG